MIHLLREHTNRPSKMLAALVALLTLGLVISAAQSFAEEEAAAEPEYSAPGTITFIGRNLLGKAKGTFHGWRVTKLDIDRGDPAAGEVVVEIDIESIDTGIGRRDNHLRSDDFFDIEKYPTATVRVHDVASKGESDRGLPLYSAKFSVRIRDVEKTIEGEFEVTSENPPTVEGGLELNRVDFGVGASHRGWNPMSVRETVPIRFFATLGQEQ
jgi:polyisoprenoid-binding protein YceI